MQRGRPHRSVENFGGLTWFEELVMTPRVRSKPTPADLDLVACPECGSPAEVEWREVAESTHGPAEHVKITCLLGHRFLMLSERLTSR